MDSGKKTEKYVTYDYVVNEIAENMQSSIEKMRDIIKNQESLADYLEKAEEKEKYQDFIKNLKDANVKYEEQIKVLSHRYECIKFIQSLLADKYYDRFASLLIEALGVANKDGRTLEEREANHETIKEL